MTDRVDVLTGTLGKALGGASGGYTSGRKAIIELLRQRSRPYLFSNTLCPSIAGATLKVLDMLSQSTELRDTLDANTRFFREGLSHIGMRVLPGAHPICAVMIGDAALAVKAADAMLQKGVYVIGFSTRSCRRARRDPDPDLGRPHPRRTREGARRLRRRQARDGAIAWGARVSWWLVRTRTQSR